MADTNKIRFSAAVIFGLFVTVYTLSFFVTDPCHMLPGVGGDGVKNVFTYLYHTLYGKGFWFDGMNYPYGEHIVYVDGQPLLSVLLSSFGHVAIGEALAVLWLLVGLSYLLSIVFVYMILIHFRVASIIALIFAGLITVFSPQVFRLGAHYGLSYLCVVPMLFYWTIKYQELRQVKYCIYVFLLGTAAAFLHPYFAAMVLVWVLLYALGYFIFTKGKALEKLLQVLPMLVSTVCMFAVIGTVMQLTDPVTDRPATPYGLLVYTAKSHDFVTSAHSPVWAFVQRHDKLKKVFPEITDSNGREGYSYIGIVCILVIIYSVLAAVFKRTVMRRKYRVDSNEVFSPIWLFVAVAALLFSMGVPYIWHMEWLLEYFPFLKQFRSLGRFSWIFYYIITIYSVVVVYGIYAQLVAKGKPLYGYLVVVPAMLIWCFEASGYTKATRSMASAGQQNFAGFLSLKEQSWEQFLEANHFKRTDFQAVLLMQYFHVGSDKLWVGDLGGRLGQVYKASFQLHLPMVNAYMSRSSWSQAKKQVKIEAGRYAEKPLLQDINSTKPLLLLRYDHDSFNADEQYMLQASKYIGHYGLCQVYACYPQVLAAIDKKSRDSIDALLPFVGIQDTCMACTGTWYIAHFDRVKAKASLFGYGASPAIMGKDSTIALIPVMPVRNKQEYEFSCWFLLGKDDYTSPSVVLELLDSAGNITGSMQMDVKQSVDSYDMWFRGSLYFRMGDNCRAVRCRLMNDPAPSYIAMDEMMLRPADALILSKDIAGRVMVNNHLFQNRK